MSNLAIPFCDHLSAEFHNRFNPESRKGIGILVLLPGIITEKGNVQHVVDGLMFWESDMPNVSSLLAEVKEWQNFRTLLRIGFTLVIRQSVHSPTCDGSKPIYGSPILL